MTDMQRNENWFIQQLARPPILEAHPFVETVQQRIERRERQRKRVFAAAVVLWLALVLLMVPLSSLSGYFEQAAALGSMLEGLAQALSTVDFGSLMLQTSTLFPLLIILVGTCVLLSVQLRHL
jgi:polyferredoxin